MQLHEGYHGEVGSALLKYRVLSVLEMGTRVLVSGRSSPGTDLQFGELGVRLQKNHRIL